MDTRDSFSRSPLTSLLPSDGAALSGEVGERYRIRGTLGRGGMATVYDVIEIGTGRQLALKRLRREHDSVRHQRNVELFAREYHALRQLSHPRIVQAYEYGLDARGPYYTMEPLDGGDLQKLAPFPWRNACAIARDLASALSLLHSRRLVHRDLSPRNVRRTADGLAKVFDFGALAPMGPQKVMIGTPPCCPPETLGMQPIDGRTDLFALGATLYFMLVGRHAYSVTHFSELHDAWQLGYARASDVVADIPLALDTLIADLLRLEPYARPVNAAEVIQRLCAIDGQSLADELQVADAYLSLPTLVGREVQLRRAQRKLSHSGSGASVVIEGAPGMGRSRFLDHCLLDATLLGTTAVRADADDARSGDYGALRALLRQLASLRPRASLETARRHRAALMSLLPELFADQAAGAAAPTRPQLQAAVQSWLAELASSSPLLIGVDDFDRIDEPSAALLSLLAHDPAPGLALAVSMPSALTSVARPEQQVLLDASMRIELTRLSRDESESLLKALFGEVPNVGSFALRLHELADGSPRDLLQLAQHLVDQGLARYDAGTWSLPPSVDHAELPNSMAQALRARVAALPAGARELASALALCPDQSFSQGECVRLCERAQDAWLMNDLSLLIEAEIVSTVEEQYRLARQLWAAAIRGALAPEAERRLQARLARVLEARGEDFRASQHWMRAGESAHALDMLVAHAAQSQERTASSTALFMRYARALPSDWYDTYCEAFALCSALQRPRDAVILGARLSALAPAFAIADITHLLPLHEQLRHDSGLDDWYALPAALEPLPRIELARERAQARWAAAPEHERMYDQATAQRLLVRVVGAALTRVANGLDLAYLHALPKLGPFAPLAPSLATMRDLSDGLEARYTGHHERTRALYLSVLERIEQPDRAGWDHPYAETTRLAVINALGVMDACLGRASSLDWAERASAHPDFRVNAEYTRMVYHLFQGDIEAADQCHRQGERLRLQTQQLYPSSHMVWELDAYVMSEDLTHMRHAAEQCARLAANYEPWRAVHDYAQAEYQRMRSDHRDALQCIQRALQLAQPGRHPLWTSMADTRVRVLDDLGRHAEALAAATNYVATAERCGLASTAERLRLTLGLCQARTGHAEGRATVNAVIQRYRAQGAAGLCLGFAHEIGARVAWLLGDDGSFHEHAERCRELYCRYANPALLVKYEHLLQDFENKGPVSRSGVAAAAVSEDTARIASAFEACADESQRAAFALLTLLRYSHATSGFLYTPGRDGPVLAASSGDSVAPANMHAWVTAFFEAQLPDLTTKTMFEKSVTQSAQRRLEELLAPAYRPVVLADSAHAKFMGVAWLAVSDKAQFHYPAEVASLLSRLWCDRR